MHPLESRPLLGNNLDLGVVAVCRLEGQKGLHSICANHGTVNFVIFQDVLKQMSYKSHTVYLHLHFHSGSYSDMHHTR